MIDEKDITYFETAGVRNGIITVTVTASYANVVDSSPFSRQVDSYPARDSLSQQAINKCRMLARADLLSRLSILKERLTAE